jgi:hypothetical protein
MGGGEPGTQGDSHAVVLVLVSDGLGVNVGGVELEPVVLAGRQDGSGHLDDQLTDMVDLPRLSQRGEVDVCGRAAQVIGSQQHATLEDEVAGMRRHGEPGQESFERVQAQVLGGGAAGLLGFGP